MPKTKAKHAKGAGQKHSGCAGCCSAPCGSCKHHMLPQVFADAMAEGRPVLMPIIGTEPPYAFSIGMRKLSSECAGELAISCIEEPTSCHILQIVCERILDKTLKPSEWKEGTVLEAKATGLAVPLRIHVLPETAIDTYFASSARPFLGLPKSKCVYQIIWSDKDGLFTDKTVALQHIFDQPSSAQPST